MNDKKRIYKEQEKTKSIISSHIKIVAFYCEPCNTYKGNRDLNCVRGCSYGTIATVICLSQHIGCLRFSIIAVTIPFI